MHKGCLYGGRIVNVASATVDNPVNLTLAGSTWTVIGISYLNSLIMDAGSVIKGSFLFTFSMMQTKFLRLFLLLPTELFFFVFEKTFIFIICPKGKIFMQNLDANTTIKVLCRQQCH